MRFPQSHANVNHRFARSTGVIKSFFYYRWGSNVLRLSNVSRNQLTQAARHER